MLDILGAPKTTNVLTVSGEDHDLKTAPKYLVYPVDWDKVLADTTAAELATGSACLTDFGESFEMATPPAELGIPQIYCSPEQVLEQKISRGCDLWALGCTLFEIRTGRKLFDTFDDDADEYLCKVAMILGKYPEPWWTETWTARGEFFEDSPDAAGQVVESHRGPASGDMDVAKAQSDEALHAVVFERAEPRSLREAIGLGLVYENSRGPESLHRNISSEEAEVFADLLSNLLKYNAEERLSASSVLEHKWFKF